MDETLRIPWREVSPLEALNGSVDPLLETVDALRGAWRESIGKASPDEFAEARRRSLRRHAIETGIIERLYDVDWGVTEALVAEGLTLEVAEREGGIDEDALATIASQFDALEFLASAAREGQELSGFFIKQLHAAITRAQQTYEGRDRLGRTIDLQLHHGEWKKQPNHVIRGDGSILEYVPPEQVQSQVDALIDEFSRMSEVHPLVAAAWLHHRFIVIHPFEDGNGRVGRALVLLVLLKNDYAPLVVDRTRREDYIRALDAANDGDLRPLLRIFAEFEIVALRSELERPTQLQPEVGTAVEVAEAVAGKLSSLRFTTDTERATRAHALAGDLQRRLEEYLGVVAAGLADAFRSFDPDVHATVATATPPDSRAQFWHAQLVRTARALDFYTNLSEGSWWTRLRLVVRGQELRYVVAIQKVGRGETGVLAVTAFSELISPQSADEDERTLPTALFKTRSGDSVTLVPSDTVEKRWEEVASFVERTLAASVAEFGRNFG